jgi:hypothetical protein
VNDATTKEAMALIGELHAAKESLRWETAMRDVVDDLTRRDQACQRLKANARRDRDAEVLHAKATTYAHASEMLRAAIASMKETP